MKNTLLVIGDNKGRKRDRDPSFINFIDRIRRFKKKGFDLHIVNYDDVMGGGLPRISDTQVTVLFFFPFAYWNRNIEVYQKDSRIYGDRRFGSDYHRFFKRVENKIKRKYKNKKIKFVNPPSSSLLERDKKQAKLMFRKNAIPTPRSFNVRTSAAVDRLTARGRSLYLKPRFGSMGKGITYVTKDFMKSNFVYRKGKVVSRRHDYNWRVRPLKEQYRNRFLKALIACDCICEEAVQSPVYKNKKFDMRIYYMYGTIPYYYVRSAPASWMVTNWSQGGKIEKGKRVLRYVPPAQIKKAHALACKVAKKLKLNYAGIDVIFSQGFKKAYVLEAHSFPGYEKGFDLMRCLARKIVNG